MDCKIFPLGALIFNQKGSYSHIPSECREATDNMFLSSFTQGYQSLITYDCNESNMPSDTSDLCILDKLFVRTNVGS